jgi:2-polyprenyl-3-methyl-5-hydroxy-6-metoxy-1,4-benzoquinol methylase
MANKPEMKSKWVGNELTADQYIDHWIEHKVWTHLDYPKHRKRLHWAADQCVGKQFVDVGCAFGHSTAIMARRHPGEWAGIDFAARAIEKAIELFPAMDFLFFPTIGDMADYRGHWDSVVCSEVIEHIRDDAEFVRRLIGMARRRVLITTPTIDAHDPGHIRVYTMAQLNTLFDGMNPAIITDKDFYYITIDVGAK